MDKVKIKFINFDDVCELARDDYPYVDKYVLANEFERLKNKRVVDKKIKIENPSIEFLFNTIKMTRVRPEYPVATRKFLESDYVSEVMKEYVFAMINKKTAPIEILALLKSELDFNEFTKEQITSIKTELDKVFYSRGFAAEDKRRIYEMFNDYIFLLNGEGPIGYIKGHFRDEDLAKEFLAHSSVKPSPYSYLERGLQRIDFNERHLMAIYKMFDKFLPEKKMEFYQMIKSTKMLSATDFVANYLLFVKNNFNSNMKYVSLLDVHQDGDQRNHDLISSRFFGWTYQYENNKAKETTSVAKVLVS